MPRCLLKAFLTIILLTHSPLADPLVVISIDGFNPSFYQAERYQAPNIKSLARTGAWAREVYPVFPSFTYPNHTALATGTRPDHHGVHTNIKLNSKEWYWFDSDIAVPTLWSIASNRGLRVALLSWPVSTDADVDFNIPEIFHVPGANRQSTAELIKKHSTPGLFQRFKVVVPKSFPKWDLETERVAVGLLKSEKIDLMMIHILQLDKAQHTYGKEHPEVESALKEVDRIVGQIVRAAGPNATIAIVGDHGFRSYSRLVYLQDILRKAGLSDQAIIKSTGGSAAVYTESPQVKELLSQDLPFVETVLSRKELDYLGAFPGADFALVAVQDYIFSWKPSGPARTKRTRGQHGYLPEQVPTGLIITGPGIAPNTRLGNLEIIHVAPTLAHLLGIRMPTAQGHSVLEDDE